MTIILPPGPSGIDDVEALIEAARRRQRRRQRIIAVLVAVVVVVAAAGYFAIQGARGRGPDSGGSSKGSGSERSGAAIRLERPGALALDARGVLYIADEGREQILERLPNGTFRVLAGTGKVGFSGDGGPDGRLYVADSGNNEVLRLERNGTMTEIAENRHYAGVYGVGHPAVHASPGSPSGLAFDRAGNLYLASFSVKTLLMITPKGIMTLPDGVENFYPRGKGALVTAPDGSVYAANAMAIVELTPHGTKTIFDFSDRHFDGIRTFLPQGIAVAPNGDIYTDTALGNGFTNKTALVVVRPGAKPRVLWKG